MTTIAAPTLAEQVRLDREDYPLNGAVITDDGETAFDRWDATHRTISNFVGELFIIAAAEEVTREAAVRRATRRAQTMLSEPIVDPNGDRMADEVIDQLRTTGVPERVVRAAERAIAGWPA